MIVVSIIGTDRLTAGYGAAKISHGQAMLSGPIPVRVLRAAQFHEFVWPIVEWGTQGEVAYVPRMRIQPVAARTVAEELAWLFAALIPEKVAKAPLNHLTAGFGIMVEKMKLLRGEPTTYGRQEVRSATFDVAKLAQVMAGLNDAERTAVTRFLDALRGSPVQPTDAGSNRPGGNAGAPLEVSRPVPAVLG